MPHGRSRRKICPLCLKLWTRQTVHRHLVLGCTRHEREVNRRKALANLLSSPRHSNPPSSPQTPVHHQNANPADSGVFTPPPAEDVRLRSPDFAFNTPGAGPSNDRARSDRLLDNEPYRFFEDEWDGNVPIDSDSDDGRPEGPTLANQAPWLEGLTASAILSQELEAQIAQTGGKLLAYAHIFDTVAELSISYRPPARR
jgi:hypothetical protein